MLSKGCHISILHISLRKHCLRIHECWIRTLKIEETFQKGNFDMGITKLSQQTIGMWGKKGKIKVVQKMGDYIRREECGEHESVSNSFHIGEVGKQVGLEHYGGETRM